LLAILWIHKFGDLTFLSITLKKTTHTFIVLENNKIPILGGFPKNLKLFDFEQILALFSSFGLILPDSPCWAKNFEIP
jgi:hypothetical protein